MNRLYSKNFLTKLSELPGKELMVVLGGVAAISFFIGASEASIEESVLAAPHGISACLSARPPEDMAADPQNTFVRLNNDEKFFKKMVEQDGTGVPNYKDDQLAQVSPKGLSDQEKVAANFIFKVSNTSEGVVFDIAEPSKLSNYGQDFCSYGGVDYLSSLAHTGDVLMQLAGVPVTALPDTPQISPNLPETTQPTITQIN